MGVENLWHDVCCGCTVEKPSCLACFRVSLGDIAEREHARDEVAGWLRKTFVETASAAARDMHHHAVEHRAAGEVGVETLVQELAQKAPALRNPEVIVTRCMNDGRRIMANPRHEIAHCGKARSGNKGIARAIHKAIESPGLKTAFQVNASLVRDQFAILHARKRPFAAWNDARRRGTGGGDARVFSGALGSVAGYVIDVLSPREISIIFAATTSSPLTRPSIPVTIGGTMRISPCPAGRSCCQPSQTIVVPCRMRKSSPMYAAVPGLAVRSPRLRYFRTTATGRHCKVTNAVYPPPRFRYNPSGCAARWHELPPDAAFSILRACDVWPV